MYKYKKPLSERAGVQVGQASPKPALYEPEVRNLSVPYDFMHLVPHPVLI